ncbi:MAG TPA: antibiotic biosynthesis monooxygenase [Rugosibacter sp.]
MENNSETQPVRRIVYRRAKPDRGPAFEELVRGMVAEMQNYKGFLGAEIIPPETPNAEYQFIFRWASQEDINVWDASTAHAKWLQRLGDVAAGDPEYRLLSGLEAWFSPTAIPGVKAPSRLKMAFISWIGIFPTVVFLQVTFLPLISGWHPLLQIAAFSSLMIVLMTWVVMPGLTRLFRPLLVAQNKSKK